MVTMLIDHCGSVFFPELVFLRVIGRIAMPLYSLMLADSCRHLKGSPERMRRFLLFLAVSALISEPFYDGCFHGGFPSAESHNQVLQFFSFALGYALCERIDARAAERRGGGERSVSSAAVRPGSLKIWVWLIVTSLNARFRPGYGAAGILLPLAYLWYLDRFREKDRKWRLRTNALLMAGFILCQFAETYVEYYGVKGIIAAPVLLFVPNVNHGVFMALPALAAYDGSYGAVSKLFKRGYRAFYPLHLAVIYLISRLI